MPDHKDHYYLLDKFFNPTTEAFMHKAGIKAGMKVLDIGCGSGIMSAWLAKTVGSEGSVIAIDNNEKQLMIAKAKADLKKLTNIQFHLLPADELRSLKEHFDFVYCRFLLSNVQHPTQIIHAVYDILRPSGTFVAEEGIESSAFTYPFSEAWGIKRWNIRIPMEGLEGHERDANFGMKLFSKMLDIGFKIKEGSLVQPFLTKKEDKALLLDEWLDNKQSFLDQGGKLIDWETKFKGLKEIVENDKQSVAFYQSCQVAGEKPSVKMALESLHLRFKTLNISDTKMILDAFKDETAFNPRDSILRIEKFLINSVNNYKRHSVGIYGIELKPDNIFIGLGGFEFKTIEDQTEALLFIKLSSTYKENEAILTEIALTLRDLAFIELGMARFIFNVEPDDILLTKIAKKIGMQYEGKSYHQGKANLIYAMNRS